MQTNRFFSEDDKNIIKAIYKSSVNKPVALFEVLRDNFFTDRALLYYPASKKIYFCFDSALRDSERSYSKELKKFWDLLSLIQFLCEESYISIMPFYHDTSDNLKVVWKNCQYVVPEGDAYKLNDADFCKDYCIYSDGKMKLQGMELPQEYYKRMELWFGEVFALKKLECLIKSHFITREEKWHRENIWWARGAVVAALLGVFTTILIA